MPGWEERRANSGPLRQTACSHIADLACRQPAFGHNAGALGSPERLTALATYASGLADLIIHYASAQLDDERFSTAPTEGAVQWLLHRRMGGHQQMGWSPRGAHLMLQVRTATVNGTLEADHGCISRHRRSFRIAA